MMGCRRAGATWATGATGGKDMVMEQIQKEAAAPVKSALDPKLGQRLNCENTEN